MHWQKITLIGVGLLGGSLGLAVKKRGLATQVMGYVRRAVSVTECVKRGAVDEAVLELAPAVQGADLVVLCTPIAQMRDLTEKLLPNLKPGAIVTDVGSVKGPVVQALEPLAHRAGAHFIGSHPMAGAEKMGVGAARADLFMNAVCVITATAKSPAKAVRNVEELWRNVGARTLRMNPDLHDEFVSRSSHLPHIVAAELANYVLSPAHPKEQAQLCANGFRDTTRIASGSPEMWRDIALANRTNLARVLGVFVEDLQEFRHALVKGDAQAVQEFFELAKQRRDQWCGQAASPSPE
ncbi:MAG: prephenate dehydrogenase/arogenate dehydrogenase family protein [Verrucomicrobia bacterium]|nr:prephenate dehydrogenase/arogenate dehydrogenase family protein [Verrucomicrobiota bacterium]